MNIHPRLRYQGRFLSEHAYNYTQMRDEIVPNVFVSLFFLLNFDIFKVISFEFFFCFFFLFFVFCF